ncbi:S-adenosyl-L-methionine-dependent methyltransferase [Trichocladium antarcticum]|uniref:S-adenosyl-L-methionine-dependent methyltransferase n=1 Tax=Trichocladium antarcticum TaxID=1450529 RepID=A0AAN6UKE0_9PEZI|nr:S-adenosyl-L-methionine-dependent methyltransferase [Trichocladium antarcticum]
MTTANTTRFNAEALSWDTNPAVLRATALAHKTYLARLAPPPRLAGLDLLDLGCGTGLLSLALAPAVRSVTAVDVASGMVDALQAKLDAAAARARARARAEAGESEYGNVRAVCALLEDADDARIAVDPVTGRVVEGAPRRVDVVVSHLVLHHVADMRGLFATVFGLLKPGGRVMVTDFEDFGPDARRFHPEGKMEGVERHGLRRGEMRVLLEEAGFEGVKVETAFEMGKAVETAPGSGVMGEEMVFPFLICEGTRP